jgi:hypothetical protein
MAKAEIPGGVAQAAMVSFSKAMKGKSFQKQQPFASWNLGYRMWNIEGGQWGSLRLSF